MNIASYIINQYEWFLVPISLTCDVIRFQMIHIKMVSIFVAFLIDGTNKISVWEGNDACDIYANT